MNSYTIEFLIKNQNRPLPSKTEKQVLENLDFSFCCLTLPAHTADDALTSFRVKMAGLGWVELQDAKSAMDDSGFFIGDLICCD